MTTIQLKHSDHNVLVSCNAMTTIELKHNDHAACVGGLCCASARVLVSSCHAMTTIELRREAKHGAAGEKQVRGNMAVVCLTGKAGVRPNIDGLVTNTSKAGVCVRHGAEVGYQCLGIV